MSGFHPPRGGANNVTHNPDMPGKPCPGLDGIYCGQPRRMPAGYCGTHIRQYQRRRYASTRKKAGYEYVERQIARTTQELCDCCGSPAPNDLSAMEGTGGKLVCGQCWQLAQDIQREFGYGRFRKIVEFAHEFPIAFIPSSAQAAENVANPTSPKPGYADELLFQVTKPVTVDQAFEYEYVKRIWATAARYGFDPDADDTYEYVETNWGKEIKAKLTDEVASRAFELKTHLTEEEAPWLF